MGEIKRDPKLDAALDKYMNLLVKAVEPTEIKPQKLTQAQLEEYEAKAKEYSRKKMEQHRAMQKDLNDKIRLKAAAPVRWAVRAVLLWAEKPWRWLRASYCAGVAPREAAPPAGGHTLARCRAAHERHCAPRYADE